MKKIFLILTLVWLGFISNAFSADYQKGLKAALSGDFVTALKEWRPLAEQGNANAQSGLGYLYKMGHGVTQDYKEALKWYRLSAEQEFAPAQFSLGNSYHNGQGVNIDKVKAMYWYDKASNNGESALFVAADKLSRCCSM